MKKYEYLFLSLLLRMLGLLLASTSIGLYAAPLLLPQVTLEGVERFGDYQSSPVIFSQSENKPAVVINYDTSASMQWMAYRSDQAFPDQPGLSDNPDIIGCPGTTLPNPFTATNKPEYNFNPDYGYYGYFESCATDDTNTCTSVKKKYTYQAADGYFIEDPAGAWDGAFLNWLTMRRVDIARKVLVGGKVKRDPRTRSRITDSKGNFILQAYKEIPNGSFCERTEQKVMRVADSANFSEIKDNADVILHDGQITFINKTSNTKTTYNVQVGVPANLKLGVPTTEPKGLLQKNADRLDFGLAVFNFDHTREPLGPRNKSIYSLGVPDAYVGGATLHPCYADYDYGNPNSPNDNYQICLETHVKADPEADPENVIRVIEEHPMISPTPIAEALYEIWGYAAQVKHTAGNKTSKSGDPQFFDDKNTKTSSYQVSTDWDPFFDKDTGKRTPCKPLFVININDGAPFNDFADARHTPNASTPGLGLKIGPGYPSLSPFGENEALDEVAFSTRHADCRPEANMPGSQQLINFFIFTELGALNGESNDKTRKIQEAAMRGGFLDVNGNKWPTPSQLPDGENFITYYQKHLDALPGTTPCTKFEEWDRDGDCTPDSFFYPQNPKQLEDDLQSVLNQISADIGSGGGGSIPTASASGAGALYQGFTTVSKFKEQTDGSIESVSWLGEIYGIFIDEKGYLRSDDNLNKTLDATDRRVFSCVNINSFTQEKYLRFKLTDPTDDSLIPTHPQTLACDVAVFNKKITDVGLLWKAAELLSQDAKNLGAGVRMTEQRANYNSNDPRRYLITGIDENNDGVVRSNEQVPFVWSNPKLQSMYRLLGDTVDMAERVVDFVRGVTRPTVALPLLRNREIEGVPYILGDVLNSSPVAVARPAESLDLIYKDPTYLEFLKLYGSRRTVVYAGANDGMLHAFNAGYYDETSKKMLNAPTGKTPLPLGKELWAYVPYNALPHLHQLTKPIYNRAMGFHRYFVDGSPYITDVRIFNDGGALGFAGGIDGQAGVEHPHGWGTILVVGMRLGGGSVTVADVDGLGKDLITRSSYSLFDITDPEAPPKLLLEFTHPDLGFTTGIPTVFTVKVTPASIPDFYLAMGSGADNSKEGYRDVQSTRNAKVFVLNLKKLEAADHGLIKNDGFDTGVNSAFVGDIVAVDFDADYSTDALYFGTTNLESAAPINWSGDLVRMRIEASSRNLLSAMSLYDLGYPVTAMPSPSVDELGNRWISVGTGRLWNSRDNLKDNNNAFFALKEPRDAAGDFTWGRITPAPLDVSSIEVENATGGLIGFSDPSIKTVMQLDTAMQQYSPSPLYSGWKRELQGKVLSSAAQYGGVTFFNTYRSDQNPCLFVGQADFWAVRYTTGTAWKTSIIGTDASTSFNRTSLDLGKSLHGSIFLHIGESARDGRLLPLTPNAGGALSGVGANVITPDNGPLSWGEF